eukprot:sb/3478982/
MKVVVSFGKFDKYYWQRRETFEYYMKRTKSEKMRKRHSNRSLEPPKKFVTLHQVEKLGFWPRPFTCIFSHVVKTINQLRIGVETNLGTLKCVASSH